MGDAVVLAIHHQHAQAILDGRKSVEVRARFPNLDPGTVIYLYVTAPFASIDGGFTVNDVLEASPAQLWAAMRSALCVGAADFNRYVGKRQLVKAITVDAPFQLKRPASRAELSSLFGFVAPQSYCYLRGGPVEAHLDRLRARPRTDYGVY